MSEAQIQPHKIKNPIQLLAVWFAALVILDGAFLTAAASINTPAWVSPMLCIASVLFVPVFLIAAIVMQTKYRTHLQDDEYFSDWLERKEKRFENFKAENISTQTQTSTPVVAERVASYGDPESKRIGFYENQRGIFLVHDWVPSRTKGQIADIVMWLCQHREGPLSRGEVEKVEYHIGPQFFKGKPVTKTNRLDSFKLEISAYGPVLCLAKVFIKGESEPIEISRYIDFEPGPNIGLD
jgi:hypothetical protein